MCLKDRRRTSSGLGLWSNLSLFEMHVISLVIVNGQVLPSRFVAEMAPTRLSVAFMSFEVELCATGFGSPAVRRVQRRLHRPLPTGVHVPTTRSTRKLK
jgi:hypothetical protein